MIAGALRRLAAPSGAQRPLVVDAGCGSGPLGELLADAPLALVGLDADPLALEQARRHGYAALWQVDLEANELPAGVGRVEALVCADLLEHCRRPEAVLRRLLETYLPAGGVVIASLPNVAHWYVRAQLLMGRFPYADRGILDRTHLRFFTAASAAALLTGAGIRLEHQWVTPLPLPALYPAFQPGRPFFPLHALSAWVTRAYPTLLAYQFIYVGRYAGHG